MEREEGELTDEDLEDVSDNSSWSLKTFLAVGKSSYREPFRELSLTSISDDDSQDVDRHKSTYRQISHDLLRKRKLQHNEDKLKDVISRKRVKKYSERRVVKRRTNSLHRNFSSVSNSSSDDSESYIQDKKILRQLRDAVRINRSHELPNCSLRTRLKRMIEPNDSKNSNSDEDIELETLRDKALQSKAKSDCNDTNDGNSSSKETQNITDDDIIQLRLIALKSAVVKKHLNRRKMKEAQQQKLNQENTNDQTSSDTQIKNNLENNLINNQKSENNAEIVCDQNVIEKETENEIVDKNSLDEDEDILRAMLLTSISKKIADKKATKQSNNVNSKINLPNVIKSIKSKNSIDPKILPSKSVVNRIIINVNSDSESDLDQPINDKKETRNKLQSDELFSKSLTLFLQQARAKTESETDFESNISHLPRSQQLEYKKLKRKLQILSSNMKPFSNPNKKLINNNNTNENKTFRQLNVINNNKQKMTKNKYILSTKTSLINDNLKLAETKTRKTDRLQIKGKYEELNQLMLQVSEAREARDKAQTEVKRLINDLKNARSQLTTSHQNYTVLVQKLLKAKSTIDKRLDDQNIQKTKVIQASILTSTPKKIETPTDPKIAEVTSTVQEQNTITEKLNGETVEKIESPIEKIEFPVEKIEFPVEKIEFPVENIEFPVEEIETSVEKMEIVENIEKKSERFLDYSSPLDHMQIKREQILSNPLLELCPYDLLGVCRDADCSYQHCGTNSLTD